MTTILITTLSVLVLVMLGLLVWMLIGGFAHRREIAGQSSAIGLLQQQLEALKGSQDNVGQILSKSLSTGQENVSQSLQANQKILSELNNQIGKLQGTNTQMLQMGSDVQRLQDILQSPKMRGQLGEWSLENLLSSVLPQGSFSLQSHFKDGRIVDALIRLPQYSVPVDAKFPLPSFEAMLKAADDGDKSRLRRQFQKDVTAHVDKIASSYIRPAEGTLDFALMYIPAENVYYETIIKYDHDRQDVLEYALEKKVIPVSPNVLYAYLMTIVMGLHGLQIEKQAAEIRQNLKKLNTSFAEFVSHWDTLGSHVRNVYNKYEESGKKLDKFGMELTQIQTEEQTKGVQEYQK